MTSGENPTYPQTDQACYHIGGTHGSLSIPKLDVWSYSGKRHWWEPLNVERLKFVPEDPLQLQIRHFCAVIRREVPPLVPGREGLRTLQVIEAIKQTAEIEALVRLPI